MEQEQKTAEVSTAQLREILDDGTTLSSIRGRHMEYATSHIPGALNAAPKPGVEMSQYVSDVAEIARVVQAKERRLCCTATGPSAARASAYPKSC